MARASLARKRGLFVHSPRCRPKATLISVWTEKQIQPKHPNRQKTSRADLVEANAAYQTRHKALVKLPFFRSSSSCVAHVLGENSNASGVGDSDPMGSIAPKGVSYLVSFGGARLFWLGLSVAGSEVSCW